MEITNWWRFGRHAFTCNSKLCPVNRTAIAIVG